MTPVMESRLPWQLGIGGLVPFLATTLGVWLAPAAWQAALLMAFLAYGAVILSFLGGIHWGLVMVAPRPAEVATRGRWLASMAPSLLAWPALLVGGLAGTGLLALGFVLVMGLEQRHRQCLELPAWYLSLRWLLTLVVLACHGLVIWRLAAG